MIKKIVDNLHDNGIDDFGIEKLYEPDNDSISRARITTSITTNIFKSLHEIFDNKEIFIDNIFMPKPDIINIEFWWFK